ncbi:MAG: hypothetical protein JRJ15_14200 [Deltaproteobacteria bacterium]|nr:hypothetical protein [Deltaproteobacteria bacterium]
MEVSFEKSTTEFCQGYNTPAQSSFLDTTKAQPMTGAIKTLKRPPQPDDPGMFVIKLNCYKLMNTTSELVVFICYDLKCFG